MSQNSEVQQDYERTIPESELKTISGSPWSETRLWQAAARDYTQSDSTVNQPDHRVYTRVVDRKGSLGPSEIEARLLQSHTILKNGDRVDSYDVRLNLPQINATTVRIEYYGQGLASASQYVNATVAINEGVVSTQRQIFEDLYVRPEEKVPTSESRIDTITLQTSAWKPEGGRLEKVTAEFTDYVVTYDPKTSQKRIQEIRYTKAGLRINDNVKEQPLTLDRQARDLQIEEAAILWETKLDNYIKRAMTVLASRPEGDMLFAPHRHQLFKPENISPDFKLQKDFVANKALCERR